MTENKRRRRKAAAKPAAEVAKSDTPLEQPKAKPATKPAAKASAAKTAETPAAPDYGVKRLATVFKAGKDNESHEKVLAVFSAMAVGLQSGDRAKAVSNFRDLTRLCAAMPAATFGLYFKPMLNFMDTDMKKFGEKSAFHGSALVKALADHPALYTYAKAIERLTPKAGRAAVAKSINPSLAAAVLPTTHHSVFVTV